MSMRGELENLQHERSKLQERLTELDKRIYALLEAMYDKAIVGDLR